MLAPGLANAVLVQHLVLGDVCLPYFADFGGLLEEAFVLRTDAAFGSWGLANLCWYRNACSRVSKRCAGVAFRGFR